MIPDRDMLQSRRLYTLALLHRRAMGKAREKEIIKIFKIEHPELSH